MSSDKKTYDIIGTNTVPMTSTVYVGDFGVVGLSGTKSIQYTIENFNINAFDTSRATYVDTDAPNGTYTYTVSARDNTGTPNESAESVATDSVVVNATVVVPTGNIIFRARYNPIGVDSETQGPTLVESVNCAQTAQTLVAGTWGTPQSWDSGGSFKLGRQMKILADPFDASRKATRHRISYDELQAGNSINFPGVDLGCAPRQTSADNNHGLRSEMKAILQNEASLTYDGKDWWWGFAFYFPSLADRGTGSSTSFIINQGHFIPETINGVAMKPNQPPLGIYVKPDSATTPLLSIANKYSTAYPDAGNGGAEISDPSVITFLDGTDLRFNVGQWNYLVFRANWSGNRGTSGVAACQGAILQGWLNGKPFMNKLNLRNCYFQNKVPYLKLGVYYANWKFLVPTGDARFVEVWIRDFTLSVDGTGSYELVAARGAPAKIAIP
jgi:hypothetical protein